VNAVYVTAVGLLAPGLEGWQASMPILRGESDYCPKAMPRLVVDLLPANERRRTTDTIRLALLAAQDALRQSSVAIEKVATVFASSDGDLDILDKICLALSLADHPVSPTLFHNSVHNAAAGYWAIATGSRISSTSLSAYNASFAAGLLEGMTVAVMEGLPTLLVSYDSPAPPRLSSVRHVAAPYAVAVLLQREKTSEALMLLRIRVATQGPEDQVSNPALEALRTGNPAAHSLPLLQALAARDALNVCIPYLPGTQLQVECRPCD
jgi:hypothetical protein